VADRRAGVLHRRRAPGSPAHRVRRSGARGLPVSGGFGGGTRRGGPWSARCGRHGRRRGERRVQGGARNGREHRQRHGRGDRRSRAETGACATRPGSGGGRAGRPGRAGDCTGRDSAARRLGRLSRRRRAEGTDRGVDGPAGAQGGPPGRAADHGLARRVAPVEHQLRRRRLGRVLPDAHLDLGPRRIRRLRREA
jgi:hypothetical protein